MLEERVPWAWPLFWVVFLTYIGLGLVGYFSRDETPSFERVETLVQRGNQELLTDNDESSKTFRQALVMVDKLPVIEADTRAFSRTTLHVALKQQPAASDLATLAKSKKKPYALFARLISAQKVTENDVKAYRKEANLKAPFQRLGEYVLIQKAEMTLPSVFDRMKWESVVAAFAYLGLGVFGLFIIPIAFLTNGLRIKGHPVAQVTPAQGEIGAARSVMIFGWFICVGVLLALVPSSLGIILRTLIMIVIGLAGIFWLVTVPLKGRRHQLADYGFASEGLFGRIGMGFGFAPTASLIAFGLGIVGTFLFRNLPSAEHPVSVTLESSPSIPEVIGLMLQACVFAPVFEELMFRGVMFPALSQKLKSPFWGAMVSSLIFAAIHPTGIPAWFALASLGMFGCLLTMTTRSIVPAVVLHATHNFVTLLAALNFGGF